MDELTNQAIDLVLENNALHKRVLEPLKQKIMPYVIGFVLFNLMILILIIYILNLLSD